MIINRKDHSRSRISCNAFYHVVSVRIAASYSDGTTVESILRAFLFASRSVCGVMPRHCM
jgi:hypothetical protein